MTTTIRDTTEADTAALHAVHGAAFGDQGTSEINPLVDALLVDPHVLFTNVTIGDAMASILAPLCVHPDTQRQGIGSGLIEAGVQRLRAAGGGLVFVLGDPRYYDRFGFAPAGPYELAAPYPLTPVYAEGWMVRELRNGVLAATAGTVRCADALHDPKLWQPDPHPV